MKNLGGLKRIIPELALLFGSIFLGGYFSFTYPPAALFLFGVSICAALLLLIKFFTSNQSSNTANAEASLSHLIEAADLLDEGLIVYNDKSDAILVNKRLKEVFEGSNIDINEKETRSSLAKQINAWIKDDIQRKKIIEYVKSVKGLENAENKEIKVQMPNGKHVAYREKTTAGNGLVSIVKEITDDVLKQQELLETHTMLSAVYDALPIGICIYDASHHILGWNEKFVEVMEVPEGSLYKGIPLQEHLNMSFSSFAEVGDDPAKFAQSVIDHANTTRTTNVERKFKSGKIVEISRTALPDGGYVCTFMDVTLEKATQLLLKESENRYRKMVELSPDAILVHKDGIIIYANTAAINLLEAKDLHSIVGDKIQKYFPVADHELLDAHFGSADHLQPGQVVSTERSQVIGHIGNRTNVELDATALLYGDRPVMQLIARDISAQTRAQELLEKAKEEAESAAQLKGTFLANMSHELRTPLNAVIGFSEIIKNEIYGKVGSEKYIEYAEDIHNSGVHLLDLINEILDLSKIESGAQEIYEEHLNINSLVDECIRLTNPQREKAKVTITSHLNSLLPNIVADNKMIKQVILNLLSNAIKFTPQGGKITISCVVERNGKLALSVEDTGIGIREDDIQKALTPFVQVDSELNRKYQGTGLGLPLSKNLMELHGGSLDIKSRYGSGTTVTIHLPSERVELSAA